MTTGPIGVEITTMDSRTGSDLQTGIKVDETFFTNSSNSSRKPRNRPEDRINDKIIDEDFRRGVETMMKGITDLPENWNDLTIREQRDWFTNQMKHKFTNFPESLLFLCAGSMINGDCKRSELEPRPDWLDHEKFLRGQRFAMENYAGVCFAELLSLYTLFSFENGLKPLIITGKSSDPFTAFKRYLSTGKRVRNWYTTDVWEIGTIARRDIEVVRKMHSNVREKLMNSTLENIDETSKIQNTLSAMRLTILEDFRGSCPVAAPGQCPHIFSKEDNFKRPKGLNQLEMAVTQFGFIGLVILFPGRFGIHGSTDDDLDAFCHVWRSLGYLLGIEDEFNFCAGTLEEVKQRSRDFLEYWVKPNLRDITPEWEHMLRCVMEGIRFYFPGTSYEHGLLALTELLDISMPRLHASMSYASWIRYNITKRMFYWLPKLPGGKRSMNRGLIVAVEKALNFTDSELEVLKERSKKIMAKGIADTIAANRHKELEYSNHWQKASFLVFFTTCLFLNLPIIVKEFVKRLINDGSITS